ncbi:MAG TPA: M24 family metallopeptidase, partial [Thermomicrobiales bacterium]|nr:M24 family metallopeptidase [Thermomicrobiales bacterium]
MIEREEILDRQNRARAAAERAGYGALLVIGRSFYDRPGDLAWLTNHFPPFPASVFSDEFRGLGHGIFILPVQGEPVLITDPRKHRADLVPVADVRATTNLMRLAIEVLQERGLDRGRIGVIGDDVLPAPMDRELRSALTSAEIVADSEIIATLRMIKSPAKQDALRAAAAVADLALAAAIASVQRAGTTERDACAAGSEAALRGGADFVRYLRVHSGPWSASGSRWPQATDRVIVRGDLIVLDAIGAVDGYGFDVNRSLSCGPTDAERLRLLETVLEAGERAVAACVAGAQVGAIHAAAKVVVDKSPFANA